MAGGIRTREIAKRYPVTTGLTADAKHEGRQVNLQAEEGSLVPRSQKKGISGL